MTALKGFESMYEDVPPKDSDIPLPGTYAHLRWVAEQKRIQQGKIKEFEPVDKDLLITDDPILNEGTVLNSEPVLKTRTDGKLRTVLNEGTVLNSEPVLKTRTDDAMSRPGNSQRIVDDSGVVTIAANYMRFDMDIFRVLTDMGLAERFVYLDLIRRSYGKYPNPINVCRCTHPEIADTTGITGKDSITRAIKSLEGKGFISRWYQAQIKGEKSLYRVYLPCELVGYNGTTKISILKGKKS